MVQVLSPFTHTYIVPFVVPVGHTAGESTLTAATYLVPVRFASVAFAEGPLW
jgi:hypothetical protein